MARTLERACFDYILLEDSFLCRGEFRRSTEIYLKNGIGRAAPGPSVVAALMTQVTSRIGNVPTFGTYAYHPYSAGPPGGDARPGVRRTHRLECRPAAPTSRR